MKILFQDDFFVAVDKPAGLLVHPTRLDRYDPRNLVDELSDELNIRPRVIHRLDKAVSGVILFALSSEAAAAGAELFRENRVGKTYIALTRGFTKPEGEINHALDSVEDYNADRGKISSGVRREAKTTYRRLATAEIPVKISRYETSRYSLLEVSPHTGRTHQIRRHLKQIRNPIIGDTKYGDHHHNRYFRERWELQYLLLRSVKLECAHPFTGDPLIISAPIGPRLREILDELGLTSGLLDIYLD